MCLMLWDLRVVMSELSDVLESAGAEDIAGS